MSRIEYLSQNGTKVAFNAYRVIAYEETDTRSLSTRLHFECGITIVVNTPFAQVEADIKKAEEPPAYEFPPVQTAHGDEDTTPTGDDRIDTLRGLTQEDLEVAEDLAKLDEEAAQQLGKDEPAF